MDLYRLTLRPRGAFLTPWHADTLAGSLCWEMARCEGEAAVGEFLDRCRGGDPPFVLSDAFPGDLLPTPRCLYRLVAAADSAEDRDDLARKWKEVAWLSPEDFDAFRGGRLPDLPADKRAAPSLTVSRLHASLDRRSNRTIEPGGLREEEEVYLGEGADHLTVYARVATDWAGRLDCLWQSLALSGFGKKKSSGMGAFDYGGLERFDGFSSPPCADGFVALSHFVPARADPADGDYSLTVKYGKLGDAWAVGTENPFKRPLAMIQPGSCFRTAGPPRPWYGRAVQGLAPGRPEAAQLAFALAAPMRWPPPAPAGRKERSDG